jgi:hypothetical protein
LSGFILSSAVGGYLATAFQELSINAEFDIGQAVVQRNWRWTRRIALHRHRQGRLRSLEEN